ncbi:helix-turn-helix transcriptional regulator [Myxacorys almedinensis]|uniref:Helix-turn-helix domain-containing protein n=1 Tax=Myxacorys almedinensis A TaxID=2690445 RepID=A0A8J7YW68_9CYAN|nr:AraC family transcriptional regulator [Myxacorys almedinensis]NDJ15742.1 helix-turn-helix domain-containing protein [Myxacorys almedinensis A]
MTKTISEEDYKDLWEESQQTGQVVEYYDEFITGHQGYIPWVGKVLDWSISLQDGLGLGVYRYDLEQDLKLFEQQNKNASWSVLSFFVSGDVKTTLRGVIDQVDELAERTYLSCCSDTPETEEWVGGECLTRLQIWFEPQHFLKNFTPEQLSPLPLEVQQAAEGTIQPYYYSGRMTPAMKAIAHQILNCSYSGIMQRFYLEGKALELMTLQFEQLRDQSRTLTPQIFLKSDDLDRIHQARDILIANLIDPPSLLELARQVAINDHKLKQGFRQVFGTTVFGYLHDYRLQQAQSLLQTREMSVGEVAHQIGYVDRSHFAAAFRKKFGLNPSHYARQYQSNRSATSLISPSSHQKTPPSHQQPI